MVFEKIAALLNDYKELEGGVTPETTFESLGFDSLDRVELAMSIEEAFGITLEPDVNMRSVQDLADAVEARLSQLPKEGNA